MAKVNDTPKLYDIKEIMEIPMPDVLSDYGITMTRQGKFKLRDERTASAQYYGKTNTYFDFGGGVGGNNINLIMTLEGCDKAQARQILGQRYGVSEYQRENHGLSMTGTQYSNIGLYGDRASKNWDFDMDQPLEQIQALSNRLAVSMNQLRQSEPALYAEILKSRAVPYVKGEQNDYLTALIDLLDNPEAGTAQMAKELLAREAYQSYSKTYGDMARAVKGTELDIHRLRPDFSKDIERLREGKLQIDVGLIPYDEFKKQSGKNTYRTVPVGEYQAFKSAHREGLVAQEYPVGAFFTRGKGVNVVVKEQDAGCFARELCDLQSGRLDLRAPEQPVELQDGGYMDDEQWAAMLEQTQSMQMERG